MQVDRAWSRRIAEQLGTEVEDGDQNAYWAIRQIPELADGVYVEGYAVYDGPTAPRKHAWIEVEDTVLDPSPLLFEAKRVQYFPGLRFTREEVYKWVRDSGLLPPVYQHGWGGFDSPEMMRASALAAEAVGWKGLAERYWQHYERAKAARHGALHQGRGRQDGHTGQASMPEDRRRSPAGDIRQLCTEGDIVELGDVQQKCDEAVQAIAALPIEQWPGWALYVLERLDTISCERHMDQERRRMLEQVERILQERLRQGRW